MKTMIIPVERAIMFNDFNFITHIITRIFMM